MSRARTSPISRQNAKRDAILAAATATFARYGYRKTSMDEVARTAGVSRQGLYLHFPTKDELFRATVEYALSGQLDAAIAALGNEALSLDARLVTACDEWSRTVSVAGTDAGDLIEVSAALAGSLLAKYEHQFELHVAHSMASVRWVCSTNVQVFPLWRSQERCTLRFADLSTVVLHTKVLEGVRIAVRVLLAPIGR